MNNKAFNTKDKNFKGIKGNKRTFMPKTKEDLSSITTETASMKDLKMVLFPEEML
jgi:hypothetical protein